MTKDEDYWYNMLTDWLVGYISSQNLNLLAYWIQIIILE